MRALREDGLVATNGGRRLVVLDWEALQSAGEFDPAYLHPQDGGLVLRLQPMRVHLDPDGDGCLVF